MPLATHRFTVDQYHRMGEAGVFHEDDRVELIDGQIIPMSPIGPRHAVCVDRLTRSLSRLVADQAIVRVQNPVLLDPFTEPQPDVSLLVPPIERYGHAHPAAGDVLLIVEVADTSLGYDRDTKLPLYARAGIPEVWLIDLARARIDVCRDAAGSTWNDRQVVGREATLRPLRLPDTHIPAADLLG